MQGIVQRPFRNHHGQHGQYRIPRRPGGFHPKGYFGKLAGQGHHLYADRGPKRGQSESYSQNMQRLGRELMTTSEITTMPGDKCILQLRGLPPFLSPKYDLKKHPNYKYTAEFDKKKNAFRLGSLFRHRPLRLKPEDEYTVYEVDGSDTDEEADLLNFDDLDSDEFV